MECASGLYYYDTKNQEICDKVEVTEVENRYKTPVNDDSMLQTVKENRGFLTRQDILDADKSRNYQALLRWPSTSTFISYASKNLMRNCYITVYDIIEAEQIYGTPTLLSKGKTKRKQTNKHSNITRIHLTLPISNRHRDLNMFMNISYVNRMVFRLSKSGKMNFYQ